MFNRKECKTWTGNVYMAGDIAIAEQEIREIGYQRGLCLTIHPTKYIYSGGEETGFVIGQIQYPRFMADEKHLKSDLIKIAQQIAYKCCQKSFTIVMPKETLYFHSSQPQKGIK